ncbi:hypothetical protein B0H14DRAFT_3512052 [Mycena olivaceomarginata]|nr:hypothetical protein B0H14DRAFT_3512052 [Mycena olivaceomarginata]
MPFFRSSTGVQINGGTFYDVGGDINVHNTLEVQYEGDPSLTLESDTGGMEGFSSDARTRQPTDRNDRALTYDPPPPEPESSISLVSTADPICAAVLILVQEQKIILN